VSKHQEEEEDLSDPAESAPETVPEDTSSKDNVFVVTRANFGYIIVHYSVSLSETTSLQAIHLPKALQM